MRITRNPKHRNPPRAQLLRATSQLCPASLGLGREQTDILATTAMTGPLASPLEALGPGPRMRPVHHRAVWGGSLKGRIRRRARLPYRRREVCRVHCLQLWSLFWLWLSYERLCIAYCFSNSGGHSLELNILAYIYHSFHVISWWSHFAVVSM